MFGFGDGTYGVFWVKLGANPGQGAWTVVSNSSGKHLVQLVA